MRHHVVRIADGGTTTLVNLASLCRRHHSVIHRTNWTMTTADDQWFAITPPTGLVIHTRRHGRQRPPTPP